MVSQDRKVYNSASSLWASYSPGEILGCAYTICSYGQIYISCTIPSGSPYPPSRLYYFTLSVLICCIRLICVWSFCLYHHITYICCFVASYQFSLCMSDLPGIVLCYYEKKSVSLLTLPFLRHVHVYLCEMSLASRLKRPYIFSSHFCSADPCVFLYCF